MGVAIVYWMDFDELANGRNRLQVLVTECIKPLVSDLPVVKYSICTAKMVPSSLYSFCIVLEIFTKSYFWDIEQKLENQYFEWETIGKRLAFGSSTPLKQPKAIGMAAGPTTRANCKRTSLTASPYQIVPSDTPNMVRRGTSKRRRT
ncbi:hypothetical protein RvY_10278 [Ramazzottius varieornatus]|uniref:Uncharacterized protein n=1 Tax=Ramazzottius varieornatus TaxID=947166 RepID=A0A1D1VL94_RAMVA|nr:hypothetical protein RvY_10278 [Ramazzottius varieornatus]